MLRLKKMLCIGFIMMATDTIFSDCFIRETEGKYVIGNEYIKVTVEPDNGGSISDFEFTPLKINLNQREGNSLEDEFYSQYPKDGKTNIYVESVGKRKFIPEIIRNTAEEVQLKLSIVGGSKEFEWLSFSKIYSVRKSSSALKVDYLCRNNTNQEHRLGIRTRTFFRKRGFFPEKNIFITPTCEGIREIEQPGSSATGQGDFHMSPSAGWEAVVGSQDGNGILVIVEDKLVSCFFNWYRDSGFFSTLEWFLREQTIVGNSALSTSISLVPLENMKRIDTVLKKNIACGISQDGKIHLISPENVTVNVSVCGKEAGQIRLQASKSSIMDFKSPKKGTVEVAVFDGKELLGKAERKTDGTEIKREEPQRPGNKAVAPTYYKYYGSPDAQGITVNNLASREKKEEKKDIFEKTVLRQFRDSVAEAYISPEMMSLAEKGICVYETDNNGQCTSEVSSCLRKEKDASGLLLWKVKGLDGRPFAAKEKDGILYGEKGKELGRIEQRYKIFLGKKSEKNKDIPGNANMLANPSFEEELSDYANRKDVIAQDDKIFKSGSKSLKITKKPKDRYTDVSFFAIVDECRNYDISLWSRQNSTGKALVTFPVYFFDKDWKVIKDVNGAEWKKYVMEQTGSFEWRKFESTIASPKNARFMRVSLSGRPEENGALWADDISIKPQLVKSSSGLDIEKEKIKSTTYKPLDEIFAVSEEAVTPHVKWLKPKSGKIPEILWLTSLKYATDTKKRELVEIAQRMSMNYKFIPLLPQMLTPSYGYVGMNGGDTYGTALEPYIIMLLQKELSEKKHDVIVVQDLNFKGSAQASGQRSEIEASKNTETVQKEFTDMLLEAVREGAGLVFYNCQNLPEEFHKILKENKVKTPEGILILPEIRKIPSERLNSMFQMANYGKGRIASVENSQSAYPCVPENRLYEYTVWAYDYCVRNFPYLEYMRAPFIKTIRWASGEIPDAAFENIVFSNDTLILTISAQKDGNYILDCNYKDIYWHDEAVQQEKISLQKGNNVLQVKIPEKLQGGRNIVHCRIIDRDVKVSDFGSIAFSLPETCRVKSVDFSNKDRIYKVGEEIKAKITLEGDFKDSEVICEVEDTYDRIVRRIAMPADETAEVSFKLKKPYTILYRFFIKVQKGEKVICQQMEEFSHPYAYPETDDLTAYIWGGGPRLPILKNVFDSEVVSFGSMRDLHAICNMNIRPTSIGCGSILGIDSRSSYKGDLSTNDPVRHPCLSNPEHWKKARPYIHEKVKENRNLYYGIRDYFMCDEFALGASVCISEYCLHDFREYLKKQYSSVGELNGAWKTSFKDWQEIVPLLLKDVSLEKDNIAAWLDHRLFMNNVYAYTWIGKTKEYLREVNPEAKLGVSGTSNPGFSMDWFKTMQVIDFLANYGGIQTNLISSFAQPGTVYGCWTGGYVPTHEEYERCIRSPLWQGLFLQNNAYMYFHGSVGTTVRGDLHLTSNMRYCMEELKEVKRGTAKLLLSSEKADVNIAVLYSQSSMFAAIATVGKEYWDGAQDSWKNLLDDLKYNFRFISSEQLAENGVDVKQYKVLILPCTLSLSKKETEKIADFVKAGGMLIADFAPGIFDEHGAKSENENLQALFGIKREGRELDFTPCEEIVTPENSLGIQGGKYITRFAEKKLTLTTAKSLGNTGNPSAPGLILNKPGKGISMLMNNLINGYSQVVLKGTGGELSEELKGPELIQEMTRNIGEQLFKGSGLAPLFSIKTPDGKIYPSMGAVFADGGNKYVGILRSNMMPGLIDREKEAVSIVISFPSEAHIYDVRKGKYIGKASQIKTSVIPAIAKLYALLPYKITDIKLSEINKEYKRGDSLEINVQIQTDSGTAGNHVFHFEAVSPEGKTLKCYSQNLKSEGGNGKLILSTALNDVTGKWTLKIRDAASGIEKDASFILK